MNPSDIPRMLVEDLRQSIVVITLVKRTMGRNSATPALIQHILPSLEWAYL